jgi:hypothetical protein
MLEILHSIKSIIERFIVNMVPLAAEANAGDTSVSLPSTRRFRYGDAVVIYHKEGEYAQPEGEVHNVVQVCDRSLVLDTPLTNSYTVANSFVEKMIGFESGNETWLDAVYIGEPDVILKYPAITVNGKSRSSEWLTLESTKETYQIDITVYVEAADYESQVELMFAYVKQIEDSLFRSLYPLVRPYNVTTFTEPVEATSTIVKVQNPNVFTCKGISWVFLESYDFLRHNLIVGDLGDGTFNLQFPAGAHFDVGDKLIQPMRHIFNALPKGTQYGTVNKGTMLKAAVISYECSEEVWRHTPYIDPLTF